MGQLENSESADCHTADCLSLGDTPTPDFDEEISAFFGDDFGARPILVEDVSIHFVSCFPQVFRFQMVDR